MVVSTAPNCTCFVGGRNSETQLWYAPPDSYSKGDFKNGDSSNGF